MDTFFDSFLKKNVVNPDKNSWIVNDFVAFCKNFKNEFGLTLWDALNEYVSFHYPYCAYRGKSYDGELFLYPLFEYNHRNRRVILKKLFYVSESVKTIFMHDYLIPWKGGKNQTPFFNFFKVHNSYKYEDFPELDFMVKSRNIEVPLAKEILMKTSFYRRNIKKSFILENISNGIEYKSTNIVNIDFDLNFLDQCHFLNAKRYSSFRQFLPPNLIISIGCKLEFNLPDIPKHLKKQQLLDVSFLGV